MVSVPPFWGFLLPLLLPLLLPVPPLLPPPQAASTIAARDATAAARRPVLALPMFLLLVAERDIRPVRAHRQGSRSGGAVPRRSPRKTAGYRAAGRAPVTTLMSAPPAGPGRRARRRRGG